MNETLITHNCLLIIRRMIFEKNRKTCKVCQILVKKANC